MTFIEAIQTISGGIDLLYEEKISEIEEIEKAEDILYKLVIFLNREGVNRLEDLDR